MKQCLAEGDGATPDVQRLEKMFLSLA